MWPQTEHPKTSIILNKTLLLQKGVAAKALKKHLSAYQCQTWFCKPQASPATRGIGSEEHRLVEEGGWVQRGSASMCGPSKSKLGFASPRLHQQQGASVLNRTDMFKKGVAAKVLRKHLWPYQFETWICWTQASLATGGIGSEQHRHVQKGGGCKGAQEAPVSLPMPNLVFQKGYRGRQEGDRSPVCIPRKQKHLLP